MELYQDAGAVTGPASGPDLRFGEIGAKAPGIAEVAWAVAAAR
jgi:hypothetical protein